MLKWSCICAVLLLAMALAVFAPIPGAQLNDRIQLIISIVLICTLFIVIRQSSIAEKDANLRQRPFVGLLEVKAVLLGDQPEKTILDEKDEVTFVLTFMNTGLSSAYVKYVKVKMYYAYAEESKLEFPDQKTQEMKGIKIGSLMGAIGEASKTLFKPDVNDEVPLASVTHFREVVLLPHQGTAIEFMTHALTLKNRLFMGKKHPLPIITEVETKYRDSKDKEFYHNSLYALTWLPAHHNRIISKLNTSNDKDQPIHLTIRELWETVTRVTASSP